MERVPAAKKYVEYRLAHNRAVMHDHGAVRTIAMDGMGSLPRGELAITRILQPLGYSLRDFTLSDEQKTLGQPMKETVETSQSGRVRQTALRAAQVSRSFLTEQGNTIEKEVPGSFLEFITRLPLPEEVEGKSLLDLGFDSSNAQAIFTMTANSKP